jgi:hypothetical protein
MNDFITCPICSKQVKQLTSKHLKMHNLTTSEFKILYPLIPLVCNSVRLANQQNSKIGVKNNTVSNIKKIQRIEQYNQHPNLCAKCKIPFSYEKRHNKFCSHSCSAQITNLGQQKSVETKQQLSTYSKSNPSGAILRRINGLPINYNKSPIIESTCPTCLTIFKHTLARPRIYCSTLCYHTSGNCGGYRKNSTRVHRSIYKNQQMDSGAELAFACLLDLHNISWVKNTTTYFTYQFEGKSGKYYPDFFLPTQKVWVEIKGKKYLRAGDAERLSSVGNIIRIMSTELKNSTGVINSILEYNTSTP